MANLSTLLHLEGSEIGGCRLLRRLGAGGMGEVYLAEQVRLGDRRVAVKIIRANDESPDDFQDAARHFLREGRLLAGFAHPNILPVHDSGVDDRCLFLIMEYAPDGSLKDALTGRGPHPLPQPPDVTLAADIVYQVAAALQYTHDRGIVHGDVKPGNILVETGPDGHRRMLLADYGVARDLEATAQVSLVTGTVAYMAPEQFSGRFSPATDQYALGVVAYQLLAGRTPFEGGFAEQMRGHLDLAPPSLRSLNPAVPSRLAAVIARALAKDPAARYPSVLAFADALDAALRSETETTMLGAPGAWDVTTTARPARGGRHGARPRALPAQPLMRARRRIPSADPVADPAVPPAPIAHPRTTFIAPAIQHQRLDRRRLGVFVTCVALLLLAMALAIGTNVPGKTRASGPALGGSPTATRATTPIPSRPTGTPTSSPLGTPTFIEDAASGDAFAVSNLSAPSAVAPDQEFTAAITLRNTGVTAWSSAAGYRLTCDTVRPHIAHSNCPYSLSASLGDYVVAPGATITFTLTLIAPSSSGAYHAWVTMAHGDALFSTAPVYLVLPIQPLPPLPTATATVTPQPTNTPGPQPTDTPTPQPTPTDTPTPQPTDTPTTTSQPTAPSQPTNTP